MLNNQNCFVFAEEINEDLSSKIIPAEARDNFEETFKSFNDLESFLNKREDNSEWSSLEIENFSIHSIANDNEWESENVIEPKVDPLWFRHTKNSGTKLVAETSFDEYTPICSTAIRTLQQRAGLSGIVLDKLPKKDYQDILNRCFPVMGGVGKTHTVWGKIHSVMSEKYVPMPMNTLFEMADEAFSNSGVYDAEFVSAKYTHDFTEAVWKTEKQSLLATYKNVLLAAGRTANEVAASLVVQSSDTGLSAARILPRLIVDGVTMVIGSPLEMEHKGEASLEKFGKMLIDCYAYYQATMDRFVELFDIPINNPVDCLMAAMKKVGISKKVTCDVAAEASSVVYGGATAFSAYDIYETVCETIANTNNINLLENAARLLTANWEDLDIKNFKW